MSILYKTARKVRFVLFKKNSNRFDCTNNHSAINWIQILRIQLRIQIQLRKGHTGNKSILECTGGNGPFRSKIKIHETFDGNLQTINIQPRLFVHK